MNITKFIFTFVLLYPLLLLHMILFDSPIIRLDYTPATDILIADLSNEHEFFSLEVREAFKLIVEHVRHYDVHHLLMDSRKRMLAIEEKEYNALMTDFIAALQTTRLRKLARLYTGIADRENLVVEKNQTQITTYILRTFNTTEAAIAWLAAKP